MKNPTGELLEVYDMDANCVAVDNRMGTANLELPAGIYFVTSDTESLKVVVK